MENEVVAEQTVRILDLQEVHPDGRQFRQFDRDGRIVFFDNVDLARHSPAVDDQVGVIAEVPPADGHRGVAGIEGWKLLGSALFLDRSERPERGLRIVDVHLRAAPRRECADETAFGCE